MAKLYYFLIIFFSIIMLNSISHAQNRILYENFDDRSIDDRLWTRIYGVWGVPESYYDLDHTGYDGTGYCFTGTTSTTDNANEVFLEYSSYGGKPGPPNPWPTDELYQSFWVKYPTFTQTVDYENIKLFYPAWNGRSGYIAYTVSGANHLHWSIRADAVSGYWYGGVSTPNAMDGNWHHYEFWIKFSTGQHRFWYDGVLTNDRNYADNIWPGPISFNYLTVGSIDASGTSIFNRAYDEIEVWDGMPPTRTPTPPPTDPTVNIPSGFKTVTPPPQ